MSERKCLECPKRKKLEYSGFWCCGGNQCEIDVRKDEREKAIDEYTEVLRPLISELRNNIEKNRYAFIDLDLIADKLKE